MKYCIFFLSYLFSGSVLVAQGVPKLDNPIILVHGDSVESFHALDKSFTTQTIFNRNYYWYTSNQVKMAQGTYSGKLLDGIYILSNRNRDLLLKGNFDEGIKKGLWTYWHLNGKIRQTENWKKGNLHGIVKSYDAFGKLIEIRRYNQGKLSGKQVKFDSAGNSITIKYKNGIIKTRKKKVKKSENGSVKNGTVTTREYFIKKLFRKKKDTFHKKEYPSKLKKRKKNLEQTVPETKN